MPAPATRCPYECTCARCPAAPCPGCGAPTLRGHYCSSCEQYSDVTAEDVSAMTLGDLHQLLAEEWGQGTEIEQIPLEPGAVIVEIGREGRSMGCGRGASMLEAIAAALNDAETTRIRGDEEP